MQEGLRLHRSQHRRHQPSPGKRSSITGHAEGRSAQPELVIVHSKRLSNGAQCSQQNCEGAGRSSAAHRHTHPCTARGPRSSAILQGWCRSEKKETREPSGQLADEDRLLDPSGSHRKENKRKNRRDTGCPSRKPAETERKRSAWLRKDLRRPLQQTHHLPSPSLKKKGSVCRAAKDNPADEELKI